MNYYIYAWRNLKTAEVFYIGMGHGNRRFSIKRNKKFIEYITENQSASFLLLQNLEYDEARRLEVKYIDYYNPSCNLTKGGERTNGSKISKQLKGRSLSESHKKKLKISAINQRRSMINNKRVVVLDRNRKVVKEFEAKYQVGIWLHTEYEIGKNIRSAQRLVDKYFKSQEIFYDRFYFQMID